MIGYALGSFVGMVLLSSLYGLIYTAVTKKFSAKIMEAWKHRPARFIVLLLAAGQGLIGLLLFIFSCYKLYTGASFTPYFSASGHFYSENNDIMIAWGAFALAMGISFIADILKGIFILTFAD